MRAVGGDARARARARGSGTSDRGARTRTTDGRRAGDGRRFGGNHRWVVRVIIVVDLARVRSGTTDANDAREGE